MVYVAPSGLTGKSARQDNFNVLRNGARSVRTGLVIIMTMFFASLALDLAVPAAILVSLLALDWLSAQVKQGAFLEGRTA
jgi:hypothetical protein